MRTSPEYVRWSLDPGRRAVGQLLDVLSTCGRNPRAALPHLVKWTEGWRDSVTGLLERREAES